MDRDPKDRDFEYIPEYRRADSLGNRLVALVRLEQFMNEKTFTPGIMNDLETIIKEAQDSGEERIAIIAELILSQSRKYLPKQG